MPLEYMVTYKRRGHNTYTKFKEYAKAVSFAQHATTKYGTQVEVRNYKTDELIFTANPEIDLDRELRI